MIVALLAALGFAAMPSLPTRIQVDVDEGGFGASSTWRIRGPKSVPKSAKGVTPEGVRYACSYEGRKFTWLVMAGSVRPLPESVSCWLEDHEVVLALVPIPSLGEGALGAMRVLPGGSMRHTVRADVPVRRQLVVADDQPGVTCRASRWSAAGGNGRFHVHAEVDAAVPAPSVSRCTFTAADGSPAPVEVRVTTERRIVF